MSRAVYSDLNRDKLKTLNKLRRAIGAGERPARVRRPYTMRSAFFKDTVRSVAHSLGRFIAIAVIAALGTGFFAGLRMTGQDMLLAGDEYYDGTNLCDARVVSTVGLDQSQVDQLRAVAGVDGVMPAYEADATSDVAGEQCTLRFHSLDVDAAKACSYTEASATSDDADYINRPLLVSGAWPEAADECLLSADQVWPGEVKLGDKVRLLEGTQDLDKTFSVREFTVVGFVHSSYYTCSTNAGATSLGSGRLTSYVYVPADAFAQDYPYTEAFITVEGARELQWGTDAYRAKVDEVVDRIDGMSDELAAGRVDDLRSEAQEKLDEKRAKFEQKKADAQAQLDDAQATLDDSKAQLDAAARKLESSRATIASSEAELTDGQAQYESGVSALVQKRAEASAAFDQAQKQIVDGWASYEDAMTTRAGLVEKRDEANEGLKQLNEGIAQVEVSIAQTQTVIDSLNATIAQLQAELDALDPTAEGYAEQKAALEAQKAGCEQKLAEAQAALPALETQKADLEGKKTTTEAGIQQLDDGIAQIDAQVTGVPERLDAAASELAAQKAAAEQGFADAQAELDAAATRLDAGRRQLADGKAQLAAGQSEYDDGLAKWKAGAEELAAKRTEAEDEFADAEAQLADAQAKVDDIAAKDAAVYTLDLTKNIGAESFRSDAGRIDKIAQVFPLIFFLVAALVSLTTMTRMVDEDRVLIGTYKALGYSKAKISSKYLLYAAVASGVGSAIGIVALSIFLPWFIMGAYAIIYPLPCRPVPIDVGIALASAGLGVGITVAATWAAVSATLREKPSELMLPRAPKAGKRILLERVRPVWRRMSFSWKVAARNLFRYKRRLCMTIIGIAGCTALLLTGLGLQNAINDIIDKQFGELYHYNTTVRMDAGATDAQREAVADRVAADSQGERAWIAADNAVTRVAGVTDDDGDQRIEIDVPQDESAFGRLVTMRTRLGHEPLALSDDGAIITEKLATHLGVKAGDVIAVYDEDTIGNATGEPHEVRVDGVMEYYIGQVVIMSPEAYKKVFGQAPAFNALYAGVSEDADVRSALSDDVLGMDGAKTLIYNDETISSYRNMLKSVDSVVVVLVVAAALLAFVVLYNLTNINIAERVREIATLKVLGFKPHEVDAYIYRETLLLALIGAVVGLALGVYMEGFVVVTAEVDQVMFGREIHPQSFLLAFALTMVFAVAVTIAMRGKLRRINMVESLKSVD